MDNKSAAQTMTAIDAVPGVGTYEWRVEGNVVTWSDGLTRVYGLTAPPADDTGFLSHVHPEDRVTVEAQTSAFLEAGDSYSHTFRIRRPDGAIRHIVDRGIIERDAKGSARVLHGMNIDVTDQIAALADRAQAGPRKTDIGDFEQRLRRVGESTGFGFYDLDILNGRVLWSEQLLRILGRDEDARTGSLELALTAVHPEDRGRVRDLMGAAIRRVGTYDFEYRICTAAGQEVWVRDRGETFGPLDPATGRAPRATGLLNDITKRKSTEFALRSTNALLEALFSAAPVGLAVLDTSFRFLRLNDELAAMNGMPIEAHLGHKPHEILDEIEGLEALYERWQEVLDSGEPWMNVEITGKTPGSGGQTRHWREHFFPIIDGDKRFGIAALVEDDTERKAAQDALRDNARQMQRILDGNIGFVGILDVDGTVLEANAPALNAAGLTREEVIGRKFWDAYWWSHDPAVAQRLKEDIAAAANGRIVHHDAVVRMKDEHLITIDFMLSPVLDDAGRVTHLVPSGFDITERKQAMEHVRLLMDEVNHRSKNVLSLVQAIARQTLRSNAEDFLPKFTARLNALAQAQDLLLKTNWDRVDLEQVVRNQLTYFDDALDRRILLDGPPVTITPQAAQSLSMVLHELATNAGKYGAMSTRHGKVTISWQVRPNGEDTPLLSLEWREADGPAVTEPTRRGFGTTLIGNVVRASFGVEAQVVYDAGGLLWRLEDGEDAVVPPA